jgi:hypothetical protein
MQPICQQPICQQPQAKDDYAIRCDWTTLSLRCNDEHLLASRVVWVRQAVRGPLTSSNTFE